MCVYQSHSTVDLIVLKMYVYDYCRREYSVKKSLTRHVKEKHIENKFYPCAIHTCKAKFIRRNYLLVHLGKIHKLDRNTSKTLAYEVKAVSSASELNKDLEDISDNEDFFDELQTNRSSYKPILEDITDDEDDLFHLVNELDYPTSADTNNNPLQQLVDECDVNGDVNVSSEGDVGENFNVDTGMFKGNEDQGIVSGVNEVDEYIVLDVFSCDDVNVITERSVDEDSVRSDVNVCSDGDVDDKKNVKAEINFTGNKDESNIMDGDNIDNVEGYVVLDALDCDGIGVNVGSKVNIYSIGNDVDINADCNVDGTGVCCDVNVSSECGVGNVNVDADDNSKVNAGIDNLPNVGAENISNGDIDVVGDVIVDYEDQTNGDNSSIYENDVDNEENDIDSHCDVNNVDDAIVISSEEEFDDMLITSINLTLSRTEKFKDGKVQSVSRTASIGYSENLSEMDI